MLLSLVLELRRERGQAGKRAECIGSGRGSLRTAEVAQLRARRVHRLPPLGKLGSPNLGRNACSCANRD